MRLRTKIAIAAAALLSVLAGAIALAPRLINLEAYRPAIIEAVRDATGRELVIDGPLKVTLFPVPVNGVPLTLGFSFDAATDKGHSTRLSLEVSSGKLAFDGEVSALKPDADVN